MQELEFHLSKIYYFFLKSYRRLTNFLLIGSFGLGKGTLRGLKRKENHFFKYNRQRQNLSKCAITNFGLPKYLNKTGL